MRETVLLTGGSGFLGSRLVRVLLAERDCDIEAIVRGATQQDAERRLARLWNDWPEAAQEIGRRVRVLRGDLGQPRLGLEDDEYRRLVSSLTHVIHSAAELHLDGPIDELRRINVGGTASLLELARAAHCLRRFSHVSTAYVAGGRTGEVREEELCADSGFSNTYEQTKYEGECLVRSAMTDLPISVFRPGMVVGDSQSGEIQTFNTVYVPLRLYLSGRLRLIPAKPDLRLNLVPVDYVAQAVARLTFHPEAAGHTFHLTVDPRHLPSAKRVLDLARVWASEHLGIELPAARFVPFERLSGLIEKRLVSVPPSLLAYFNENRCFLRENVDRLLGPYAPDWDAILPRLLEYGAARGFLRRTGRTVHEQVLARLQSHRLPLRVHDIAAGASPHLRSGEEMCGEILAARRSLEALGVGPRDRVALVGHNSSRFLSLDVAVGLLGAVSVPLYYTSPPTEIEAAMRVSGARVLFVGARGLLSALEELNPEVQLVSFCSKPAADDLTSRVLTWEAFLALAGKGASPGTSGSDAQMVVRRQFEARAGLEDIATVRFTSGTTGEPKGATFRHAQLVWMAESVAAILPWKARISHGRYLSFLPMNHVVEGILGTYSPAYMPAPVDVYFLEDIHALPEALARVHPTVFFSVPRFYEKLWERFIQSRGGGLYRVAPAGSLGRLARPILRRSLLRAAGLDRCLQLIVGSAPASRQLLEDFRELGIELHNAYGLTEAPLVTINRLGKNRIGTVGTPLPETELRLADDGELFVRGPQVAAGSRQGDTEEASHSGLERVDRTDETVARCGFEGWLATGDLASIDSEGCLVIEGRKKDILVTSYGKNVSASKIEGMLRSIPGVFEALVLGDNRPALCALLWLSEGTPSRDALSFVDRAVEAINARLSNPERLKRWAVLAEKPTIESEELTGNLKVKRAVVAARRAPVVALLYEDLHRSCSLPAGPHTQLGIVHVGRRQRVCA